MEIGKRKRTSNFLIIGIGFSVLIFYFLFDPVENPWMPQCVFYKFTGLQCMGCGSQRMIHALLHGDFITAFHANALVLLSIPLIIFLGWIEIFRYRFPVLYARIHKNWVIITISAILFAWLIVRNIFGF